MNDDVEFAEEYSTNERIRIIGLGGVIGAVLIYLGDAWFFPWLTEFSASAACRTVFGVNGVLVLFYGLFVGLPLLVAIGIGISFGRRGIRILREGRVPPSGEKVFRPTRIARGAKAKTAGVMQLVAVIPPLALALWGFGQAENLARAALEQPQACASAVDHNQ